MRTVRFTAILVLPALWLVAGCASQFDDTEGMEDVQAQQRTVAIAEWDENNDGALDEEEFRNWMEDEGTIAGQRGMEQISEDVIARGLVEWGDRDGDGNLNRSEWQNVMNEGFSDADEGSFQEWDSDSDTDLDENEIRQGLASQDLYEELGRDDQGNLDGEEVAGLFFELADRNSDGRVGMAEWNEFAQTQGAEQPAQDQPDQPQPGQPQPGQPG